MEEKKTDIAYDSKILLELKTLEVGFLLEAELPSRAEPMSFEKLGCEKEFARKSQLPRFQGENTVYGEAGTPEIDPQSRKGKVLNFLQNGPPKRVNEIAVDFQWRNEREINPERFAGLGKNRENIGYWRQRWRKYEVLV